MSGLLGVSFGALGGLMWTYTYRRGCGEYGMGVALIFYFANIMLSQSALAGNGKSAFILGMLVMGVAVKLICWRLYR
ncbi:MAG: hypothetical protein AAB855_01985, partial [Patescibacteria group bacterium]